MRIGEVAAGAAVNIQTLRYYERMGLLPKPARGSSGYRSYDAHAVRRVRFIKRAQELGFTLAESEPKELWKRDFTKYLNDKPCTLTGEPPP